MKKKNQPTILLASKFEEENNLPTFLLAPNLRRKKIRHNFSLHQNLKKKNPPTILLAPKFEEKKNQPIFLLAKPTILLPSKSKKKKF